MGQFAFADQALDHGRRDHSESTLEPVRSRSFLERGICDRFAHNLSNAGAPPESGVLRIAAMRVVDDISSSGMMCGCNSYKTAVRPPSAIAINFMRGRRYKRLCKSLDFVFASA